MSNKKLVPFIIKNDWLPRESSLTFGWGNGYVIIPKGHRLYEKSYDDVHKILPDLEVHGGLTFSDYVSSFSQDGFVMNEQGFVAAKAWFNQEDWVIGFDTAHYKDTLESWSIERVMQEARKLKKQINES